MFRLTILLALVASCAGVSQLDCPDLYDVFIYDLCYRVYKTPANFTEAKETCNQSNRPLAVIHNGWVASYLTATINTETGVNNGAYWIGLQRASNTSQFFWDDGSVMNWTLWNLGYPNGFNQVAASTFNGRWMTMDASEKHVFACSFDPKSVKTTTSTGGTTTGATARVSSTGAPSTQAPSPSTQAPTSAANTL